MKSRFLRRWSICEGLHCISYISVRSIIVESDYLEVVCLLNDVSLDLTKVSCFIYEAKSIATEFHDASFIHVWCSNNDLAHFLAFEALKEQTDSLLYSSYPEWFVSLGVIFWFGLFLFVEKKSIRHNILMGLWYIPFTCHVKLFRQLAFIFPFYFAYGLPLTRACA